MLLIFRSALRKYSQFEDLSILSDWRMRWHSVRLSPGNRQVYETAHYNDAVRFVVDAGKAIKRGLAEGADWVDLSRLPGSAEVGSEVLITPPRAGAIAGGNDPEDLVGAVVDRATGTDGSLDALALWLPDGRTAVVEPGGEDDTMVVRIRGGDA